MKRTTCCVTPNDAKLSDGGAWRSCEGGAKKEARDVGQRWLGVKTPKPESAATVTHGAVRCSAWLGVRFIIEKLETRNAVLCREARYLVTSFNYDYPCLLCFATLLAGELAGGSKNRSIEAAGEATG